MATSTKKHRSRRRVAALNFLSNISLDGSHRDTNYAIFKKRGIFNDSKGSQDKESCESQSESENLTECNDENRPPDRGKHATGTVPNASEPRDVSNSPARKASRSSDLAAAIASSDSTGGDSFGDSAPTKRYRASSFSGERPSCSAHHQKRKLVHTLSSSEDHPCVNRVSSENLSLFGSRSRHRSTTSASTSSGESASRNQREIRFIKPGKHKVKNERLVLLSGQKSPFVIYSLLPYSRKGQHAAHKVERTEAIRMRHASGSHLPTMTTSHEGLFTLGPQSVERVEDGQDISYSQFLVPSRCRNYRKTVSHDPTMTSGGESSVNPGVSAVKNPVLRSFSFDPSLSGKSHISGATSSSLPDKDWDYGGDVAYHPNILDDPELRSGKHRTLMTFPSYMTSVIDYVKPSDLKKELNEKFREKFPHIQLTLSKLRSLKREMKVIAHSKCDIDLWTVAQAYVYFEKIILKGLINKPNRKLCAGACLMLSAKLNDYKSTDLTGLIQEVEDAFRLHRKDLLAFEFAILVALEFSLHIPTMEIHPHVQRLQYIS